MRTALVDNELTVARQTDVPTDLNPLAPSIASSLRAASLVLATLFTGATALYMVLRA